MKHTIKIKLLDEDEYHLIQLNQVKSVRTDIFEDKKCIKIRFYYPGYILTNDFTIDQFNEIWNEYLNRS